MDEPALTPTQEHVLQELISREQPRPDFDAGLGSQLRTSLEEELNEVADALADPPLVVSKQWLNKVHQCELHYVAEKSASFAWSAPLARGTIAHRAIQISTSKNADMHPGELVETAVTRFIESDENQSLGEFLQNCPEVDLAELKVSATDAVAKFQDSFPPIARHWVRRIESAIRAELCNLNISLRGKPDLALGKAAGNTARVLIIDLKTGRPTHGHMEDGRFYALLETLRTGVPPFRVASFYLDSGQFQFEDVSEDVLWSATKRVIDGAKKIADLDGGRKPTIAPGPMCRFCVLNQTCEGGIQWNLNEQQAGSASLPDEGDDEYELPAIAIGEQI